MTSTPGPEGARTLGYWLSDPELLRQPVVALPHLVVEGRVTLLSGREKVGKSTLVAGVVAAASRGRSALGEEVSDPVRTLWYALDEPHGDCVRRFKALDADLEGVLVNRTPRSMAELLAAIRDDLDAFSGVDVMVLDNLSRVLAASGCNANQQHEVEPLMDLLVKLCHDENLAAVLLYHTGKSGREYRGSTALGATVDDILTLRRRGKAEEDDFDDDAPDDGRRLLVQDGRNLRGRLQLTCSAGRYTLFDEAHPPRERILEALVTNGSVAGRSELIKLAGVRKDTGLKTIAALLAEGLVHEEGRSLTVGVPVPACATACQGESRVRATALPSSHAFLEGGTGQGTAREPGTRGGAGIGSRFRDPPSAETGTSTAVPSRPAVTRPLDLAI